MEKLNFNEDGWVHCPYCSWNTFFPDEALSSTDILICNHCRKTLRERKIIEKEHILDRKEVWVCIGGTNEVAREMISKILYEIIPNAFRIGDALAHTIPLLKMDCEIIIVKGKE